MKVQYININDYKYRVEYIPYEESTFMDIAKKKRYVMLRNFSLMNNIVCDDNIYFIENQIFDKYINEYDGINETNNIELVFPSNKDTMYYSDTYHIFNETYLPNDIIQRRCVYDILEKKEFSSGEYRFNPGFIPCDIIKIYHPAVKNRQNLIVHIENVINNIHFHYICNTYNWYYQNNQYGSEEELRYDNNIYSEYIKCYIPSIRELFDRIIVSVDTTNNKKNIEYDYKWYFKENLNIADFIAKENKEFIKKTIIKLDKNYRIPYDAFGDINEDKVVSQYVPLALFTQPCIIQEYQEDKDNNNVITPDEKIFKKTYFKYYSSIDNNYITTPLNVSLYPYESLNKMTRIYTLLNDYLPSTASISYDYSFSLATTVDFDHEGNISLISYFNYPLQKELFEKRYGEYSLTEAYCYYHHIINRNSVYVENIKEIFMEEMDDINSIDDIDEDTIMLLVRSGTAVMKDVTDKNNKPYYIEKLKESRWEVFLDEYIDQFKASIDFFGFRIEIASDKYFKHIILSKNVSLLDFSEKEDIVDIVMNSESNNMDMFKILGDGHFFFNLTNTFTDWKQLPDMIVARVTFIDRFIGNEITSNEVYINKEDFKYIVNYSSLPRLNRLVDLNDNMIELNLNSGEAEFNKLLDQCSKSLLNQCSEELKPNLRKWYSEELKPSLRKWYDTYYTNQYSFINKVNCIVKNDPEEKTKQVSNEKNTRIIYKPIFFRTNKLNNVTLKYMQNQNIGIDLHEYLSKVDSFMMTLGGNTYYEIGRNSNFVLFNIAASNITDESGTFEIYNSSGHEYITYGNWSIIR